MTTNPEPTKIDLIPAAPTAPAESPKEPHSKENSPSPRIEETTKSSRVNAVVLSP